MFTFRAGTIDLDELREVHAIRRGIADRRAIGSKAIGRNLELASGCKPNALNEYVRAGLIAAAHDEVEHQLGVSLQSDERVAPKLPSRSWAGHALGTTEICLFLKDLKNLALTAEVSNDTVEV